MIPARQILEILRSHVDGDEERFRTAALQLAANEARQGHEEFAHEVKRLVEKSQLTSTSSQSRQAVNSVPFNRPQGDLVGLLDSVQPKIGLNQLVLSSTLEARLRRVVKEQQQYNRINEHGLRPRQKLLLLGPPGCGKTITAHALAHELKLPLYLLRLDALFTKFMGETASKLRLVFDAIERQRAVFLFDEFDSLGLARGAQHYVAEMRRVLNSFLVFIDNMHGNSLVIAASNHPEVLDPALFRRFDDIIEYSMPSRVELLRVFKQSLASENISEVDWPRILKTIGKINFAEAVRIANDAAKEKLIEHLPAINTSLLLKAITERIKKSKPRKNPTK